MVDDYIRGLSADVVVISVALLGVTLGAIALVWRRFRSSVMTLPRYWMRQYLKATLIVFGVPILCPVAAVVVVGVYYPFLVRDSVLLVMIAITGILLLYVLSKGVRWVVSRMRRKGDSVRKLDADVLVCIVCMLCLGLSAWCSLVALLGASPSALAIHLDERQVENLNWARWILNGGVILFVIGVFEMSFLYVSEGKSRRK